MNDSSSVTTPQCKQSLIVFLDTGLQRRFIPLVRLDGGMTPIQGNESKSLLDALRIVETYKTEGIISQETYDTLDRLSQGVHVPTTPLVEADSKPWLRYRFGRKTWKLKNGMDFDLYGIWVLIETNTADGRGKGGLADCFDRGYFYKKDALTEQEKATATENARTNKSNRCGTSHYIDQPQGTSIPLKFNCKAEFSDSPEPAILSFDQIYFELVVRAPAADPYDVDIILDLGNTRTAGLFFEHAKVGGFSPDHFSSEFKAIRLLPDPLSGEYDSPPKAAADGIADSWFVLHELEHQKFKGAGDPEEPELLQDEWKDVSVQKTETGLFFKKTTWEVSGAIVKRIPQMFTQLSPVLIGDAAKRQFDWEYTRMLVELGLNIQQSSPKRYYWDSEQVTHFWCLILNEWDKYNDGDPRDDPAPPLLQGEMLRFINEDGTRMDLAGRENLPPHRLPGPYPEKPQYPRQSTLTWFLLHILERAYSQVNNGTFAGAAFTRRRLRNVLITYPSGWTNSEVERYRDRCQEALDIFSETNVYHGVKNEDMRLQMVSRENSPDEAVAGQLPFVFSEIIRYPGQTAQDWIATVGKARNGKTGVRMMNFDIGGGTTDISIIEYRDENEGLAAQNLLSTELLFKDGQALAGDDLLKQVVEEIIFKQLIDLTKDVKPDGSDMSIGEIIADKFSNPPRSNKEQAVRSRIVRTCLIPLGTHCLAHAAQETVQFTPAEIGITEVNWDELNSFIGLPGALKRDITFASTAQGISRLVESTFNALLRNCALYAAAYDVDMVVFSGKTSELPGIREMAETLMPLESERIIFARSFQPGPWYPFVDAKGYISDAKTVTVVGAALYYALSSGFINGWAIHSGDNRQEIRNDWGEYKAMMSARKTAFLDRDKDEQTISLLPNSIIARRQNICSTPEAVYKLLRKSDVAGANRPVTATIRRVSSPGGEALELVSVLCDGKKSDDFELRLWPCADEVGFRFWQDTGIFENIG